MKIGDKVSFLSETGGGTVAGFQGKDIVLVEDEDGFQIPMPLSEVVVSGHADYSTRLMVAAKTAEKSDPAPATGSQRSIRQLMTEQTDDDTDDDTTEPAAPAEERPVTFRAPAVQRKGGDALSLYLAFVPIDIRKMTETRFEVYLVNDCNYHIHYSLATLEGQSLTLRAAGEIEPNMQVYVEEIGREDLNDMLRLAVQAVAYKRDMSYMPKPPVDVRLRLEPVKFYKVHTFEDTPYFDRPALVYTLIERDVPRRPVAAAPQQIEAGDLYARPREEEPKKKEAGQAAPARSGKPDGETVVDLHITELTDSTQGMTHADILDYQMLKFRQVMDAHIRQRGKKIIFIHGKGDGVLRHALIQALQKEYRQCRYQDASFREYGYGATQVIIG